MMPDHFDHIISEEINAIKKTINEIFNELASSPEVMQKLIDIIVNVFLVLLGVMAGVKSGVINKKSDMDNIFFLATIMIGVLGTVLLAKKTCFSFSSDIIEKKLLIAALPYAMTVFAYPYLDNAPVDDSFHQKETSDSCEILDAFLCPPID